METETTFKDLWVEKYRPDTLEHYLLNTETKDYFSDVIKTNQITNLCFAGPAGSGKTTLAKILAKCVNAEILFVPCSTQGTLDVLRSKVTEFCNAMSFEGRIKVVILDEIDSSSSSGQNNFQLALRTLIEEAQADTRFLITCNYIGKIIPAIISRCPVIPLSFNIKDLFLHVKFILDSEKITYTKETLKLFVENVFPFSPDIRKIIGLAQFCSISGTLNPKINISVKTEDVEFIKELVKTLKTSLSLLEVRKFYLNNKDKIPDYLEFSTKLFEYLIDNDLLSADGIIKFSDKQYELQQAIDKESMFFALLVIVKQFLNKLC